MSAPILLIIGPLVPAGLIFATLRRWPRAAAVCGFVSALLIAALLANFDVASSTAGTGVSDAGEFRVFGWALAISEGLRRLLVVTYVSSAVLFLVSGLWPQGPVFVPAALAALSPLVVSLMITPLTFGIMALLVAATFIAALVQSVRAGSTTASLRYLLLSALALPVFLIAGWMLDSQQLALGGALWRLIFLGATVLLAGFPFHIWVRPLLNEAHPLSAIFVLGPAQLLILSFVWRWLQQNPELIVNTPLDVYLGWSGAATALAAALLAFNERDPRRLLGALALADMGATLICLGQGVAGIENAWALILMRFLGLLIAVAGLEWATRRDGDETDWTHAQHLAHYPPAATLFAYGALSLIGVPLTPGFAARWTAVTLAGTGSIWWALALLLAIGGSIAGILRVLGPALNRLTDGDALDTQGATGPNRDSKVATAGVLVLAAALAFYPWPLLNLFLRLNELF